MFNDPHALSCLFFLFLVCKSDSALSPWFNDYGGKENELFPILCHITVTTYKFIG